MMDTKTNYIQNHEVLEAIQVETTPLLATIKIDQEKLKTKVTEEHILNALKQHRVEYGIQHSQIKNIVYQNIFDRPVPVAFHTPAQEGTQGWVDEKIKITTNSKPLELIDGSIDYKNINTFVTVQEGTVIGEVHPPQPGRNGVNIFGRPIFPQTLEDWKYKVGQNIVFDENEKVLVAEKSGILYKSKETIHIDTKLVIKGSVDYSTGHIKFNGDILICGDVMPGFEVEAQGDIHIEGNVESGLVTSTHGNIKIDGGVLGKHTSYIKAHQNIDVGYAQGAELYAGQNIFFNLYLLNCNSIAKVSIKSKRKNAFIAGGSAKAQSSIWVSQIGNKSETRTQIDLCFFDHEEINKCLTTHHDFLTKINASLIEVSKNIKIVKKNLSYANCNKEEAKKKLLLLIESYQSIVTQRNNTIRDIDNLNTELKIENNKLRSLTILKNIYPHTNIFYGEGEISFKEKSPGIHFDIVEGVLEENEI